jgi:hypothetical protein
VDLWEFFDDFPSGDNQTGLEAARIRDSVVPIEQGLRG